LPGSHQRIIGELDCNAEFPPLCVLRLRNSVEGMIACQRRMCGVGWQQRKLAPRHPVTSTHFAIPLPHRVWTATESNTSHPQPSLGTHPRSTYTPQTSYERLQPALALSPPPSLPALALSPPPPLPPAKASRARRHVTPVRALVAAAWMTPAMPLPRRWH